MSTTMVTPEGEHWPCPLPCCSLLCQSHIVSFTSWLYRLGIHSPHASYWRTYTVLWAQRSSKTDAAKNYIYLTISVPDVPPSKFKLDLTPSSLAFTGYSETLKQTYHVELEFYAEIDKEESKINHTAKNIEMILRKKELKEEFWPRLLKDAKKVHFLKTDFDKVGIKWQVHLLAADDFSGSMRMSKMRRQMMI